jgi:integrase
VDVGRLAKRPIADSGFRFPWARERTRAGRNGSSFSKALGARAGGSSKKTGVALVDIPVQRLSVSTHASARISLERFRAREWHPALRAAGLAGRRIYDLRHTYAAWSLAAGISLFAPSRRMGTSLAMNDATSTDLAPDAEEQEAALLNAFDSRLRPERAEREGL